jgi:glycosyltransferase involved in cell wall biosynthesis
MRIAIFDNLANSAYIQAKLFNRLGQPADLIIDPLDSYVMSDPRWEELDMELPTDQLNDPALPEYPLPEWVRHPDGTLGDRRHAAGGAARRALGLARKTSALGTAAGLALRRAGWRGVRMAAERAWVVRRLSEYDCVVSAGMGPAWAALADRPCVAQTWGGDITMVPFYDTGDWEGHDSMALPGPRRELAAQAKLQRLGYERAGRLLLADPRFQQFAERLGHAAKAVHVGIFIDTEKYRPQPEIELRERILAGAEGPIVFVPARQDWYWKGSDRLLRGFATAARRYPSAVLVCAGWGADLEPSRRLIAELGIGERVRMLPCALSKSRLRRYYCAADVVADQFTVGSYGGSALEAMSCERPVLIHLDRGRFETEGWSLPPVMNVSHAEEIAVALERLFDEPDLRSKLGSNAREWAVANHGPPLAERVIELAGEVAAEKTARKSPIAQ